MYSKIKNDDEWWMCHCSSSGCQTLLSVMWQLECMSEKQREEEGPCSPNKRQWQMLLFTVFACHHVHHFPSSSSICIIMFVIHQHCHVHHCHCHHCVASLPWWYVLHRDECESAQNAKQGSSALGKNPKTPNTHSLTHTHTITILVQEFGAFDIEKYHLCSQKSQ